jgi:hypothetical protein
MGMRRYYGYGLFAASAVVMLCACAAAQANPLLGKWRAEPNGFVTSDGLAVCEVDPEIEFTATQQTLYQAATQFRPAAKGTTDVVYQVAGNKVMVAAAAAGGSGATYIILGPNEIQATDMGNCKYTRE